MSDVDPRSLVRAGAVTTPLPPRPLPGTTSRCQLCKRPIVWATTVAGPNGPGGKAQAFQPLEDFDGNVAILVRANGRLWARALHKDETVDRPVEFVGMPHVAACTKPAGVYTPVAERGTAPDNVVDLAAARSRRRR